MKTDLDLLIEYYETEKQALETQIKLAVAEGEYLSADYNATALREVNRMVGLLNEFKTPGYMELQELRYRLQNLEAMSADKARFAPSFVIKHIESTEANIARTLAQIKNTPLFDTQEVDDALFAIYEGKCVGFKLVIKKSVDMHFKFSLHHRHLLAISFQVTEEIDTYLMDNYAAQFTKVGFIYGDNNLFTFYYNMANFKDATPIKTEIAKWLYDILYNVEFDNPATLEYVY
ncbi:hypothetical protein GCM10023149_44420 [Mucilaginibacter gynuensis]|uniref:Uncharacterized protein n=1 Tax=Mucilaginibacter gynuensis TaxID=1302236 RepID=A0ABP8H8Y5_9SPHI